jgi:hypothetical protein
MIDMKLFSSTQMFTLRRLAFSSVENASVIYLFLSG